MAYQDHVTSQDLLQVGNKHLTHILILSGNAKTNIGMETDGAIFHSLRKLFCGLLKRLHSLIGAK